MSHLSFLEDIQDCAHNVLMKNWNTAYTNLIYRWDSDDKDALRSWYVDDRCNPQLFFGILAFARPDIFEKIYTNPNKCKKILLSGLSYIYDEQKSIEQHS